MFELEAAVDDVRQQYRRLHPLLRAGIHDQMPDLADALQHLDSLSTFTFNLDDR